MRISITRLSGLIVSVLLIFSFSITSANSSVKAGAICAKAGASKTVGGKKLVCSKSGKKLVWKIKKTKTKVTAPANPATPAEPTPPTAEPDYRWYGWSFRINDAGVLQRRGGPITNWSEAATRPGEVIDPIRLKAFENMKAYQAQVEVKPVTVNMYFGPNVAADVIAAYKVFFNQSRDYFASRIPAGTVLDVVISSEKDDDFRLATYRKVLPNEYEVQDLFNRERREFEVFRGPNPLNNSGGGSVSGTSDPKRLIYSGSVCSCFKAENLLMYNIPHEMTHYFQFAVTPGGPKQNFITSAGKLTEGKIYIPHAMGEGSANVFGSAITVSHVGWYSDQMNWHLGRFKRDSGKSQLADLTEVINLLNNSESYLPAPTGMAGYEMVIGQLAYEYFVANYGVEAYLDLYENIYKLRDFEQAMQATIKKSKAEFYQDAAPYVLKAFNEVKP